MQGRRVFVVWAWLVSACSCGGASTAAPEPTTEAPVATLHVDLEAPGLDRARFVSATLGGDPLAITGCVMPESAPCEESMRVEFDDDASEELGALLADVGDMPRCEPEALQPGDRTYRATFGGNDTVYAGPLPADPTQIAARTTGPCRADARLVWWVARWLIAATRAASEQPSIVSATVDASRESSPRFTQASIDFGRSPLAVEGCTSSTRSACAAMQRVELDSRALARLGALLEDVRSEPCHAPFPSAAPLTIETGLLYDGPCGADADLAWWAATRLDPSALSPQ